MSLRVWYMGRDLRGFHHELISGLSSHVRVITDRPLEKMKPESKLTNKRRDAHSLAGAIIRSSLSNRLGLFVPRIARGRNAKAADVIVSFNRLVVGARRLPWILFLENPTAIVHYEPDKLKNPVTRSIVHSLLSSERLAAIVCMSDACRRSFLRLFPALEVGRKLKTIYPLVRRNPVVDEHVVRGRDARPNVNFLFVSSYFHLKGGKEVVSAFERLYRERPNVRLTLITKIDDIGDPWLQRIAQHPAISLHEFSFSRKELMERIYPSADVFVVPTYKDSFGLVFLEAMKAGLPIIAVDTYALSEMVTHGYNGFLCRNPIPFFQKDGLPNKKYWGLVPNRLTRNMKFDEVESKLFEYMVFFVDHPEERIEFSLRALQRANQPPFDDRAIEHEWVGLLNSVIGFGSTGWIS